MVQKLPPGGFSLLKEFFCYAALPINSAVSHVFNSSFDIPFNDFIINFTSDINAASPLSVVVSSDALKNAANDTNVSLTANRLNIGGAALSFFGFIEHKALAADKINPEGLSANLKLLEQNLKLFGKNSVVKKTLLGLPGALLSLTALNNLIKPNADLTKLLPYVGAGEGLTPSFDDFSAAIIYADAFCKTSYFNVPQSFLAEAKKRTTKQACQQYMLASNAHFTLQFESFANNLFYGKIKSADIIRLLNWGHSSGTDILCGFALYARLMLNNSFKA